MEIFPEMFPGVDGAAFTVTANVCTTDEPQALFAFTIMFPPAAPAIALMLVVLEVQKT